MTRVQNHLLAFILSPEIQSTHSSLDDCSKPQPNHAVLRVNIRCPLPSGLSSNFSTWLYRYSWSALSTYFYSFTSASVPSPSLAAATMSFFLWALVFPGLCIYCDTFTTWNTPSVLCINGFYYQLSSVWDLSANSNQHLSVLDWVRSPPPFPQYPILSPVWVYYTLDFHFLFIFVTLIRLLVPRCFVCSNIPQ